MFNMKLARARERELQQVLCCYGSQYKKYVIVHMHLLCSFKVVSNWFRAAV